MNLFKKLLGWSIVTAFAVWIIFAYTDMVIKDGWWRGLLLPLSLLGTVVGVLALAAWLILSSNKK